MAITRTPGEDTDLYQMALSGTDTARRDFAVRMLTHGIGQRVLHEIARGYVAAGGNLDDPAAWRTAKG